MVEQRIDNLKIVCYTPLMDSNDYMNEYMKKRYKERCARAIQILGGCCAECGSINDLELDHIDPSRKRFSFAKIWNYSLDRFDEELKEAQLLCKDCHKQKTSEEQGVPHGGGKSGKRNCPCDLCKAKRAEYMYNYRLAKGR